MNTTPRHPNIRLCQRAALIILLLALLIGVPGTQAAGPFYEADKFMPSDGGGASVAIDGSLVAVASYESVYLYDCSVLPCVELTQITASDSVDGDDFGASVAISGTTVVVGAPHRAGAEVINAGAVYVYDCSSVPCIERDVLTYSEPDPYIYGDTLGSSVAISGTLIVTGAPIDDAGGPKTGAAWVFDCSDFPCVELDKLTAPDPEWGDGFGQTVDISGTMVVAGTPRAQLTHGIGGAYLFDCSSIPCEWVDTMREAEAADDQMGASVAISGSTVAVGAPYTGLDGSIPGVVYLYQCSTISCTLVDTVWGPSDEDSESMGKSVALSGTTLVAGGIGDDSAGFATGAAFLYDCSGLPCSEIGTLLASDGESGDRLGWSVAINGARVVAGAPYDAGGGLAYLFRFPHIDLVGNPGFGLGYVNSDTVVHTFTVHNLSATTLPLASVSLINGDTGDFQLSSGPTSTELAPGDSATFDVTFAPTVLGVRHAILRIASGNDPAEPPVDIPLTGTGINYVLPNTGFEGGDAGTPEFWTLTGKGASSAEWACNPADAYTGDCAITLSGPLRQFAAVHSDVLTGGGAAGETFKLGGVLRGENLAQGMAALGVIVHHSDDTTARYWVTAPSGAGFGWTGLRLAFTTAKPYDRITVGVLARPHGGTVWVDDLSMVRAP